MEQLDTVFSILMVKSRKFRFVGYVSDV